MDVQVSGLDVRDILSGIHEIEEENRRGGTIRLSLDAKTHEARYAKGTIALAGISNTHGATDMSYQLSNLDFRLGDGEVKVEFDAHVGDSDGYLDKISYMIFLYS